MNVNNHDDNNMKVADDHPTRIQTAIRRATQLVDGEILELVMKKEHRHANPQLMTLEGLYTNAKSPAAKRKRRIEGLQRHAAGKSPPLPSDLRYRTVHPNAKNFELEVLNLMDNHHIHETKKQSSNIYKELSKQERMIKNQGKNVLTKKYQLCQSSLGELLRKSKVHGGGDGPSRIVLSTR